MYPGLKNAVSLENYLVKYADAFGFGVPVPEPVAPVYTAPAPV